ncbi:peroxiredoxin-like family protein [Mesorhizobium sp. KR9-304]|uniref:peroxiredoxin-like family protein n=1 Tax=Mesorhizobium sp. KR9-304 TaxID=3156614 RepID=UPI0032B3D877
MSISRQFETLGAAVQAAMETDAPLNERLSMIASAVATLNPKSGTTIARTIERLTTANAGASAPGIGDRMPPFLLPDENGRLVSLSGLLRDGPVVVTFQRGHWCPYCRVSTVSLVDIQDEVSRSGAHIVAILPERRRFTTLLKTATGARFPFLTDMDNGYALSLGLVIWVGLDMERMFVESGIDLPQYQDSESWFLPIPATFVVGSDGVIVARYVDPDWRRRMEISDLLSAIRHLR